LVANVTRPRERRGGVAPVRVIEMVTGEVVARAEGVLIEMLDSDDPRRRDRAADKILSSWAARDHPLSPARR
jgi:hypothetical protein